ncbi:unnamed protein product [marine sediment metagenome]|uniref:Uncharacterized protein n=1 Tax=marine sediment metagenome TaxID=412755 RepID=X1SRP8_9ZZZZ
MTLANNIQNIEKLACSVIFRVNTKEYKKAHYALDDIEKNVRAARRHIDHLQNVRDFCVRPAGGD